MMLSLSLRNESEENKGLTGDVSLKDTFSEVAQKVLNTNMNALTETYSLLDEAVFSAAIDSLHEAERIYFFGVGASLLTAMKAMNKFLRIEPKVYCVCLLYTSSAGTCVRSRPPAAPDPGAEKGHQLFFCITLRTLRCKG